MLTDQESIELAGQYLETLLGHFEGSSLWLTPNLPSLSVSSAKRSDRSFESRNHGKIKRSKALTEKPSSSTVESPGAECSNGDASLAEQGTEQYKSMARMTLEELLAEARLHKRGADAQHGLTKCHSYLLSGLGYLVAAIQHQRGEILESTILYLHQSSRSAAGHRPHLCLFKAFEAFALFRLFIAKKSQIFGLRTQLEQTKWSDVGKVGQFAKDTDRLVLAMALWDESIEHGSFLVQFHNIFSAFQSDQFLAKASIFLDQLER